MAGKFAYLNVGWSLINAHAVNSVHRNKGAIDTSVRKVKGVLGLGGTAEWRALHRRADRPLGRARFGVNFADVQA